MARHRFKTEVEEIFCRPVIPRGGPVEEDLGRLFDLFKTLSWGILENWECLDASSKPKPKSGMFRWENEWIKHSKVCEFIQSLELIITDMPE